MCNEGGENNIKFAWMSIVQWIAVNYSLPFSLATLHCFGLANANEANESIKIFYIMSIESYTIITVKPLNLTYFNSWAIAAICSTRSWWAAKSDSKASCFFFNAFKSFSLHWRKSCDWSISSLPRVQSSWVSAYKSINNKQNFITIQIWCT